MALSDFFKKKKEEEFDPIKDLVLSKLRKGYLVEYDLKTWEITGYYHNDFGDGYMTEEWELTSGREKIYLERSEDDDIKWTLSKKIPIGSISGNIRQYIIENDEPTSEIIYNGKSYYLDESGSGYMTEDGDEDSTEFIYWDFIDKKNENFITIEQWDETKFETAEGFYVEEYQFSNILPGKSTE